MSKEKQIEEIRNDIFAAFGGYAKWEEDWQSLAEAVYNAGYRKQSEVAREIIADLVNFADDKERQMSFYGHSVWYIDADDVTDFIAELKKKYTA